MEPLIRAQRVSEALRIELTEMVGYELADPRVEGVQVTEVHVGPDLKKAKVMVSIPAGKDSVAVLEALNGTDVPHPEAIAVCDDESVIGACFYLMGHVDGWSPMGMGDRWPDPFDTDVGARKELGIQLVDGIARLARVDWKERGLEGFGKPDGFLERQADRWISQYEALKVRDLDGVGEVADWLRANTPSVYEPGIIHGDYQFANVMYGHGAPAQLAAIVDWEMATVGDPTSTSAGSCRGGRKRGPT